MLLLLRTKKKNQFTSNDGLLAETSQTSSMLLYTFSKRFLLSRFKFFCSISFTLKPDNFNLDILSEYVSTVSGFLFADSGS